MSERLDQILNPRPSIMDEYNGFLCVVLTFVLSLHCCAGWWSYTHI